MKANHNKEESDKLAEAVVVNISKSKNESKSQRNVGANRRVRGCGQYQ